MSHFAKVVIENVYGKGEFVSECFDMGGFKAKIKLRRPIRPKARVNLTLYVMGATKFASDDNKNVFNANQIVRILRQGDRDPFLYDKSGDIAIDNDGNGSRAINMTETYQNIIAKGGIIGNKMEIEFSVVPRKKKCHITVGVINKPSLPSNYNPAVRRNYFQTKTKRYDSRKETGYIGIRNQGATCYMNAILQTLFHLPAFRGLTYSIPTTGTPAEMIKDMILNLQILFFQLQTNSTEATTHQLTYSFGWTDNEVIIQQDSTEFWGVLLNAFSEKISGNYLREFNTLFQIQTRNFATPIGQTTRTQLGATEPSLSLSLRVQGFTSVEESLQTMLMPYEMDEQIEIGGVRTNAIHSTVIKHLPDALLIQLMRFTIDGSGNRVKLDNRISYNQLISISSEEEGEVTFSLHSVVCHSGNAQGGHYFAYIRPTEENKWFCFNDTSVLPATEKEVFDDNFDSSAYLLLYVRADKEKELYRDVPINSIPEKIKSYSRKDIDIIFLPIITNDTMQINCNQGVSGYRNKEVEKFISIDKNQPMEDLLAMVTREFSIEPGSFLLWACDEDGRPRSVVSSTGNIGNAISNSKVLYLETNVTDSTEEGNSMIAFIKVFNPTLMTCTFYGSIHVNSESTLQEIAESADESLAPYKIFIENGETAKLLPNDTLFGDQRVGSGSIIVIQKDEEAQLEIPEEPVNYLSLLPRENDGLYSTFLSMRSFVSVSIALLSNLEEPLISILCPQNIPLCNLREIVSPFVGLEPENVLLFSSFFGGTEFYEIKGDTKLYPDQTIATYERVCPDGTEGVNAIIEVQETKCNLSRRFVTHFYPYETIEEKLSDQIAMTYNIRILLMKSNFRISTLKLTDSVREENSIIRVIYNSEPGPFIDVSVDEDRIRGRSAMFFSVSVSDFMNYEMLKEAIKSIIGVENSVFNHYRCKFCIDNQLITDSTMIFKFVNVPETDKPYVHVTTDSSQERERGIRFYN